MNNRKVASPTGKRDSKQCQVLEAWLPRRFKTLDLGSGPGSLSLRILEKLPGAEVVAVDFDPVMLRIGREALKPYAERINWVDADIGSPGWAKNLPVHRFDAAVNSTGLHWLNPTRLSRLYRDLAGILRVDGIFLNGDILPWDQDKGRLREMAEKIRFERYGTLEAEFAPNRLWWQKLEQKEKSLSRLFEQRKVRSAYCAAYEGLLSVEFHKKALSEAGFKEIEIVWQDPLRDRVLMGIR